MEVFPEVAAWHPLVRVLVVVATGGGALALVGRVLDKLWPSANRRLDDARDRRQEDDETIERLESRLMTLERERDAALGRYYAEREAHIATKERMVATDARLELLATRFGIEKPVMPDDVARDRQDQPPGKPHDDREALP